ncbi:hypothetical protein KHP62_17215 [Rhodobacteraceae bacterium NNCM2]|nr:hypothetical protein [Coraliihabitans acroporae]
MPLRSGEPYTVGPFMLDLAPGWEAEFVDGVHEIVHGDGDATIHISGFSKDTPIGIADLHDLAASQGGEGAEPVTFASGLDGLTFDRAEEALTLRYWVIRQGTALILVTLTCAEEDFAAMALPAQLLVSSIRPASET